MSSLIDKYVNIFVSSVSDCHTIDCVLIKLSSTFFAIKDFVEGISSERLHEADLVDEFLNHPKVMRVLAGLANSIDYVGEKIRGNVRFKNLRPYLPKILNAIRQASQTYASSREFAIDERPPLWRIEYHEKYRGASIESKIEYRRGIIKRKPYGYKRHIPWKGIVAVMLIVFLALWFLPYYVPFLPQLPLPSPTDISNQIAGVVNALTPKDDINSFIRTALDELNEIRQSYGIPPVELINLSVATWKAEYMAEHDFLSHYDVEGRHPVYYYTRLDGGLYAIEENVYVCYNCGLITASEGERMIRVFIHEDAESSWEHRDSLLDPCNNYVAIGVARNGDNIYATVYMIANRVEWIEPPTYGNGVFYAKGVVELPPETLYNGRPFYPVIIYRDMPSPDNYHKHSYDVGDSYAGVLPSYYQGYYSGIKTIKADIYKVEKIRDGWLFEIRFKFTPPDNALYTIMIFSKPTDIKWEPKSPYGKYRLKHCEILTYTIQG